MLRHIIYLIGLSVAAVYLKSQLVHVVHFLMLVHHKISNGLGIIFSDDAVGEILQAVLALLLIPVVVGVLIALVHFIVKQQHFPHTMTVIWICWAVLLVSVMSGVSNHSASVAQNNPTPNAMPNSVSLAKNNLRPSPSTQLAQSNAHEMLGKR